MSDTATDMPVGPGTGLDSAAAAADPAPAPPVETASTENGTEPANEQQASVLAKLAAIEERLPAPEQTPEPTTDDFLAALTGDDDDDLYEDEPDEPASQYPTSADQPMEATGDPRVDALIESHNQLIGHLQHREQQDRVGQLQKFADDNPQIRDPEVQRDVISRLDVISERAGDPSLRTDPAAVEQAFKAAMYDRAQAASASPQQERREATLETGAGASVEGEASSTDQRWAEIKQAGGFGAFG